MKNKYVYVLTGICKAIGVEDESYVLLFTIELQEGELGCDGSPTATIKRL